MKNHYYEIISEITKSGYFSSINKKVYFHLDKIVLDLTSNDEGSFNDCFLQKTYTNKLGHNAYSKKKALTCIKKCFNAIVGQLLEYMIVNELDMKVFKNVTIQSVKKTSPSVDFSVNVLEATFDVVELTTLKFIDLSNHLRNNYRGTKEATHLRIVNSINTYPKIHTVINIVEVINRHYNPFSMYSSSYHSSPMYVVNSNQGAINYLLDSTITFFVD